MTIAGRSKRYLRLVGDRERRARWCSTAGKQAPERRVRQRGRRGHRRRLHRPHYTANGFFAINAVGYTLTNLSAVHAGVYGVYAFNTKGGDDVRLRGRLHSDAGFYIGQTPQQTKPVRAIVPQRPS